MGGVWHPNVCVPKMARSDFPVVNFVVARDGPFGLGEGGGLLIRLSAVLIYGGGGGGVQAGPQPPGGGGGEGNYNRS